MDSIQQQGLSGQAIILLSWAQTENVKAEVPIADVLLTDFKG